MKKKTVGRPSVNLAVGKGSHIVLIHHQPVRHPLVTAVKDFYDDTIQFTPVATHRVDNTRAHVRIVRIETTVTHAATGRGKGAAGAAALTTPPTDGLLSVTLIDETSSGSGTGTDVDVADVPVDYIDDPNAADDPAAP